MKRFIIGSLLSLGLSSLLVGAEVEHTKEIRIKSIPISAVDSKHPIGYLNSQIIFISDQLERNLDKKYLANAAKTIATIIFNQLIRFIFFNIL